MLSVCASLFGLFYLIEIVVFANKFLNLILSALGLVWFRLPLLVGKARFRTRIIIGTVIELFDCLDGEYISAYVTLETRSIGLAFTIPHLVMSILPLPFFYEGTIFSSEMEIKIFDYAVLIVENFLTVSFFSVFVTLPHFWILFVVCPVWRLVSCCESYAFWSSLHSVVSPFRAIRASRGARTMLPAFLLFMEVFLTIYCAFWYMERTAVHLVFAILYAVYAAGFLVVEVCSSLAPFTHRIRPIQTARADEPEMFDPAVL
jgi:hypothetical protein